MVLGTSVLVKTDTCIQFESNIPSSGKPTAQEGGVWMVGIWSPVMAVFFHTALPRSSSCCSVWKDHLSPPICSCSVILQNPVIEGRLINYLTRNGDKHLCNSQFWHNERLPIHQCDLTAVNCKLQLTRSQFVFEFILWKVRTILSNCHSILMYHCWRVRNILSKSREIKIL